jgi:hypothetical protein
MISGKSRVSIETLPLMKNGDDLLKSSTLYQEFLAEREEILRHKWIESEKNGKDIGFEQALTDWIIHHRSEWRKNRLEDRKGQ